jgi:hypothetical protein
MAIPQNFSASYKEARQKFLEAARDATLIESHVNPKAKGVNGEELATDVARYGTLDAAYLLIICSGTHGTEGPCGSGCQLGLITEGFIAQRPASAAVLLIHAINPYGFSHIRRVTEDNVDLNRNFQDFSQPLPANPAYAEIHDALVPADWDGPARAGADAALQNWRDQHGGIPAFQAAVAGGQYTYPDGLFYGGQGPTWSNHILRAILHKHGAAAKRVAFIDIHTGLGPEGYGEPISIDAPQSPSFKRAQAWWGNDITSTVSGTSQSPPIAGALLGGAQQSLPHAEVTAIALEFGTTDLVEVLGALRGDNWLYARGLPSGLTLASPLAKEIKKNIRNALYVDTDSWKEKVFARTADFTLKAFNGLTNL